MIASCLLLLLLQPAQAEPAPTDDLRAPDPTGPTEVAAAVAPGAEAVEAEPAEAEPAEAEPEPAEPEPAEAEPAPSPSPAKTDDAPKSEEPPADPRKDPTPIRATHFLPGNGFELASDDRRFRLMIRVRMQVRYEAEHPNVEGQNSEQLLYLRRMRLQLHGNVFGKHNRYYVQFGFSDRDMSGGMLADEQGVIVRNPIRDARVEFDYLRDLTLYAGQMKVPFSRQRVNSSGNLNMVDRSLINEEFQLDRDLGIQLLSKDIGGVGLFAYYAGVFMGEGRNHWEPDDFAMLYVGRFEITPLGKFKDYSEGDIDRTPKPKLSIGGAYAFVDNGRGTQGSHGQRYDDLGTADTHNVGVDAVLKWRGLSFNNAFHWRRVLQRDSGGAVDEMGEPIPLELGRSGLGWFGQLGYLVPKIDLELVGRYAFVRNVFGAASSMPFRDEAGAGINYYFAGHNLKLQLDYFRMWGLAQGPGYARAAERGTDRVRLQVQLAF